MEAPRAGSHGQVVGRSALRVALLAAAGLALAAVAMVVLAEDAEAAPTYRVWATREGLVGHTTANGHVIKERDHFVALPTREALSAKGSWAKSVKVCNPSNGRCETAPVWDVGPWNIHDDYWSPSGERDIYAYLKHGGACCLRQGLPASQAAYESGYNGGRDEFGRTVLNRAGIDLADGTFWDGLGMTTNGWVDVTFLWLPDPPPPPPSDTTDPTTTASLSGTAGDNGWWRSAVTVRLSASDNSGGSGVASTHYRVDGGAWKTYGGPFAVGGEGGHRVDFYSKDKAGNTESTRAATFSIDTVAPGSTIALAGTQGNAGWWRSAVTATLGATDATSGVASLSAIRDGAAFTYAGPFAIAGDGSHRVDFRARDKAGNVEAWDGRDVRIDATPPATSMAWTGPSHQGAHLYVAGATRFSLAASDATSGTAATTRSWRGAAAGYAGPFGLAGADGPGTLAWRSEDRAGNLEGWRSREVWLDTAPPALAVEAPADGSVVLSLEPTRVLALASDDGAGVARVEFLVDGRLRHVAAAAPYAWDWTAGDEALGDHALVVRAVDHLGHVRVDARTLTTVPTTPAGAAATADHAAAEAQAALADPGGTAQGLLAAVQALAPLPLPGVEVPPLGPPGVPAPGALPVVGLVAEADPSTGYRIGVTLDDDFLGLQGEL